MAIKATIFKAALQIADMDRSLYADHQLTLARHPSETDERMMIRLLAFALNVPADNHQGALEFGKGLSDTDEPDLWQKDLTGQVVHWIDVGQPDDKRLIRASGRAERVTAYSYSASTLDLVERHRQQGESRAQPRRLAGSGGREPGAGCPGAAHHATAGDRAGRRGVDGRRQSGCRAAPVPAQRRLTVLAYDTPGGSSARTCAAKVCTSIGLAM